MTVNEQLWANSHVNILRKQTLHWPGSHLRRVLDVVADGDEAVSEFFGVQRPSVGLVEVIEGGAIFVELLLGQPLGVSGQHLQKWKKQKNHISYLGTYFKKKPFLKICYVFKNKISFSSLHP